MVLSALHFNKEPLHDGIPALDGKLQFRIGPFNHASRDIVVIIDTQRQQDIVGATVEGADFIERHNGRLLANEAVLIVIVA